VKYTLVTENGNAYIVNEKMEITSKTRYHELGDSAFSGEWKLVCFYEIMPFGNTKRITISDYRGVRTHYNNGKSRILVGDYDHGTTRIWGDKCNAFYPIES
jgi:hypothetical protein